MSQVEPNANRRSYGPLDAKFLKKSAEAEKESKEKQNAKHRKGTF